MTGKVEMEEKKILTLKELIPMAIGNVLGAGAFTHIGIAIGYTGYSAWLAYLAAVILGILFCLPIIIMTSALQLDGGVYTLVGQILGKRAAGIYASGFLFYFPGIAIVALSLGNYVHSLWPAISPRWCAVAVVTLFYLLNLAGIKKISKAQKIIMAVTLCALFGFVFFGVLHISPDVFAFSREDFLQGGVKGFFKAVFILFYSVTGYYFIMFQGRRAKEATKNIPVSMCVAAGTILLLYPGIGLVAAGVLPLETVANQPLTRVAEEIFPGVLFVVFMLCGPLMALMGNINSLFLAYTEPIQQAAEDGWFGDSLKKRNKHGTPVAVSTLLWLVGSLPILLGLDIATITNSYMLLDYILIYFMMFSLLRVPKLCPVQWQERRIRIPTKLYFCMVGISITIETITIIAASTSITPVILVISLLIIGALFAYALLRDRSGKVRMDEGGKEDYEQSN